MPSPDNQKFDPHGFTIFCDDIRDEVTGKKTYIGVYGDDMVVAAKLPTALPSLHFVIHLFFQPGEKPDKLTFQIAMPGDDAHKPSVSINIDTEKLVTIDLPKTDDELLKPRSHFTFRMVNTPFTIEKFGRLRVSALWNDLFVPLSSILIRPPSETKSAAG